MRRYTRQEMEQVFDNILGERVAGAPAQGIHEAVLAPRYVLGSRLQLGDKVYHYCRANTGGTLSPQHGMKNQEAIAIAYTTLAANALVGATQVVVAQAGALVDDYKGGHAILGHNAVDTVQNRGIIASTATDGTGNVTLTLDAPLHTALTLGVSGIEVMKSHYGSVAMGGGVGASACAHKGTVCVPAIYIAVTALEYFWGQTWGPCWLTPGAAGYGATANERMMVFDGYGSVQDFVTLNHTPAECYQLAGFLLDNTVSPEDCSYIMLQIAP